MSHSIIRIAKMTAGSCKGIEIHDRREKEGISHTNKDIDWERTKNNYALAEQQQSYYRSVQDRIAELDLNRAVRKDAIVMAQALVTSDHAFFENLSEEEQRRFFEDSLRFLEDQYGKENIISANVHMDERTPHMHVNFVPVTEDGKLSAKRLFTRSSLTELQDKFHDRVGRAYDLERGERGSKAKHLDVITFKATQRAQELERLEDRQEQLEKDAKALQAKSAALETKIDRNFDVISRIELLPVAKKTLLGKRELSQEEYELLRNTAKAYYMAHAKAEEMTATANRLSRSISHDNLQRLAGRNEELEKEVAALKKEVKQLPELKERCERLEKNLEWYSDYYRDQMLNIAERVSDKDKEWLFDTVIPKWSKGDVEKDLVKALETLLHPKSKVKELVHELCL